MFKFESEYTKAFLMAMYHGASENELAVTKLGFHDWRDLTYEGYVTMNRRACEAKLTEKGRRLVEWLLANEAQE